MRQKDINFLKYFLCKVTDNNFENLWQANVDNWKYLVLGLYLIGT